MKRLMKKLVAATALAAMVVSSSASADQCYDTCGGCGYEECRRAPCIAPCVALGAIALAAIIAVAIQNSSCDHNHN
ncbi:MAG: hypothetical protein AAGG81_06840 [Chlamydiota bacterium]